MRLYKFSFEKLSVWQDSSQFAVFIYKLTNRFPKEEKYGIVSQMRRAVVSISSNLAEGSSRTTSKDKMRYTQIAYGSLMEVLSQSFLCEQLGYISKDELNEIKQNTSQIAVSLNNLRKSQQNYIQEDNEEYGDHHTLSLEHNPITPSTHNPVNKNFFAHETAVIDQNCQIGAETKIWHFSHIMSNSKLGKKCNIGQNVVVSPGVELGNNVKVQNNVSIYTGVICENDVFLGPSMVFTNVINPRSAVNRKNEYLKTVVKKGASIGANATIVCGNDIGEFAFIGAGAVVTKPVPPYALLVGNPARQIGWISEFGHRLDFDENGVAICEESKVTYLLKDGLVNKEFLQNKGSY